MPDRLRELLIIRHAKSDWSDETLADIDRPLAEKGKKQACKMGHWLAAQDLVPQRILVSPAVRTQQTLARLTRHWPHKPEALEIPDLYNATTDTLTHLLRQQPDELTRIAIIGHNPGLETLLSWLTGDETLARLSTCAIAQLLIPGRWEELRPREAKLVQLVTPKNI
ncbi:MAG TPA: histidine phosphatase family protein [Sulfurivirga caldicuralii]|nr:histidine phosphatase family protein [Sulfurivirga caldicuralii]